MSKRCTVEFDGASKGNPGHGGAGAVIRDSSGSVVSRVSKSMGYTTNNAAEYGGLIAGLEKARELGYNEVHAKGDSRLVCEQVGGNWQVRSSNLHEPYSRVQDLAGGLNKFEISHVPREYNTEADAEANRGASSYYR